MSSSSSSISSFLRLAVAFTLRMKRTEPMSSSLELPSPVMVAVRGLTAAVLVDGGVLRVGVEGLLSPWRQSPGCDVERESTFSETVRGGNAAAVEPLEGPVLFGVLSGDESTLRR